MNELSKVEADELIAHERTIEKGMATFLDVGNSLLAIRDKRLYRDGFDTFEDYCRQRWNMSRVHAHRLIESAQVVGDLLPTGNTPATERQARPLARLEPEQRREAWSLAQEIAPNGKPTAKVVEAAAAIVAPKPEPPAPRPLPGQMSLPIEAELIVPAPARPVPAKPSEPEHKGDELDGAVATLRSVLFGVRRRGIAPLTSHWKPIQRERMANLLAECRDELDRFISELRSLAS